MERLAAEHLVGQGMRLLESNYHCRGGEIDLIMRDGDTLVFVEVRYRRNDSYGSSVETVHSRKQHRLMRCARHYLMRRHARHMPPCRFDIVGLSPGGAVQWIRNAFSDRPV